MPNHGAIGMIAGYSGGQGPKPRPGPINPFTGAPRPDYDPVNPFAGDPLWPGHQYGQGGGQSQLPQDPMWPLAHDPMWSAYDPATPQSLHPGYETPGVWKGGGTNATAPGQAGYGLGAPAPGVGYQPTPINWQHGGGQGPQGWDANVAMVEWQGKEDELNQLMQAGGQYPGGGAQLPASVPGVEQAIAGYSSAPSPKPRPSHMQQPGQHQYSPTDRPEYAAGQAAPPGFQVAGGAGSQHYQPLWR